MNIIRIKLKATDFLVKIRLIIIAKTSVFVKANAAPIAKETAWDCPTNVSTRVAVIMETRACKIKNDFITLDLPETAV